MSYKTAESVGEPCRLGRDRRASWRPSHCNRDEGFFAGCPVSSRSCIVQTRSSLPLEYPGNQAPGCSPNAVYLLPRPCFEGENEFDLSVQVPSPYLPDLLHSRREEGIAAERGIEADTVMSFSIQPRSPKQTPGSLPQTLPLRRIITMSSRCYLFRPIKTVASENR